MRTVVRDPDKYFAVHVRFVIDGIEVISEERGVALVDLALSMQYALERIASGNDASIGFTESDEVIKLRTEGDVLVVTSSKRQWRVEVGRDELMAAFAEFVEATCARLVERVPELAENPVLRGLRSTGA